MATCLTVLHQGSVVGVTNRQELMPSVAVRIKSNNEENITSFAKVIFHAICQIYLGKGSVINVTYRLEIILILHLRPEATMK
jgi:hypothetical protein